MRIAWITRETPIREPLTRRKDAPRCWPTAPGSTRRLHADRRIPGAGTEQGALGDARRSHAGDARDARDLGRAIRSRRDAALGRATTARDPTVSRRPGRRARAVLIGRVLA